MAVIRLGFKAFDAHELLCHFVAVEMGLHKKQNLEVELVDITFTSDADMPESLCQASCGAALASALQGIAQRVLLVATDKPMFWIVSSAELTTPGALAGKRLATFPAMAPPHHLANIILKKAGVGAEQITLLPARDDVARIGLLRSGNADAAVISSAISPLAVEKSGLRVLAFIGDEIRIPTTGLATHQGYLEKEPELTSAMVVNLKESLATIRRDPGIVAKVLQTRFDMPAELSDETARRYQKYYTEDGCTSKAIAQGAIDSLSKSMNFESVPECEQIYLGCTV
jgi:ABC-type nitrate/sulfonate/bicarbonate transport system substrate-binding protein